MALHLQLLL
jgi:hypothetical protein